MVRSRTLMGRFSSLAIASLAPSLFACEHTYVPRTPPRSGSGPVVARLDRVDIVVERMRHDLWSGTASYSLALAAPPATTLTAVTITRAGSRPCRRGLDASTVSIDGRDAPLDSAPPIDGAHRVVALFGHPQEERTIRLALDLEFGTPEGPRCERIDVAGTPDAGWRTERGLGLGMVVGMDVPLHPVGHVIALLPFQLAVGGSVGRFRLTVEPGLFAIGPCEGDVCSSASRGRSRGVIGIPFGGGATWYPWKGDRFGLELRLREYALWVPLETGTRFELLHAPATVLHFGVVPAHSAVDSPWSPGLFALDIEVPVGVIAAHEDSGNRVEPYSGVGTSLRW